MPDRSRVWSGHVFRAHVPSWSWSPLSGEGARLRGGRYNPTGVPALYTSLLAITALREASGLRAPIKPITLVSYRVASTAVADLTLEAVRQELGIGETILTSQDWRLCRARGQLAPSQAIAERLTAQGVDGVVVPSMAFGAGPFERNLVLWKWNEGANTRIQVIDDEGRLPEDRASWRGGEES